jgi:hypothetical protein
MDDIVKQAMAKWPHVPNCYGWLGLDGRGDWYLRDDEAQAIGAFGSDIPGAKGSRLEHEKLIEFIHRNYAADEAGCWYFQNGPQRVYVELQYTPWIWRVDASGEVASHTGTHTKITAAYTDAPGHLYLATPLGVGLVHTADMERAVECVERGLWTPVPLDTASLQERFGFICSPAALKS